jgi:hypothetical protein
MEGFVSFVEAGCGIEDDGFFFVVVVEPTSRRRGGGDTARVADCGTALGLISLLVLFGAWSILMRLRGAS